MVDEPEAEVSIVEEARRARLAEALIAVANVAGEITQAAVKAQTALRGLRSYLDVAGVHLTEKELERACVRLSGGERDPSAGGDKPKKLKIVT